MYRYLEFLLINNIDKKIKDILSIDEETVKIYINLLHDSRLKPLLDKTIDYSIEQYKIINVPDNFDLVNIEKNISSYYKSIKNGYLRRIAISSPFTLDRLSAYLVWLISEASGNIK